MKYLVSELEGAMLDAAVALTMGMRYGEKLVSAKILRNDGTWVPAQVIAVPPIWEPSTNWAHGGPIIERYKINIREDGSGIFAAIYTGSGTNAIKLSRSLGRPKLSWRMNQKLVPAILY